MTKKRDDDPTDKSHPMYDPKLDPTHESYEASSEDDGSKAEPSENGEKVRPGHPPKGSRWKPGCPSPNSKGRPKKVPSMKPDLKKALEAALNEKLVVTKDNKKTVLTKAAFGIQQLVTQFARGNKDARRDLFKYAAELGVDLQARNAIEDALGITSQAALDDYVRRRFKELSAEEPAQDHVKAPTDLTDDDVIKPEPDQTLATSSQPGPPAKKLNEPVLDEQGRPLGVDDIRHVQEMRRRNLAQQRKNQGES